MEYLGHNISRNGIRVLPKYIEDVQHWPEPTTVSKVRGFMGKVNYYRKFIPNFAKLAHPLTDMIMKENNKKGHTITLTPLAKQAFEKLKANLATTPILAYPRFNSSVPPFILDTDWSHDPRAIGGVLSQEQDGHERVISYGARKLTAGERNYSSNKGE